MEDLSKNQLILLALLVSFVTSIATGIATVSLIDQAPPRVVQTINRVVERTVETVTPDLGSSGGGTVTTETTVVVKEEDVITESIGAVEQSLVRLYADREIEVEDGNRTRTENQRSMVGLAIVVSEGGQMITSSDSVLGGEENRYEAVFPRGQTLSAEIRDRFDSSGITVLEISADRGESVSFAPLSFVDTKTLRLGQTALLVGGRDTTSVAEGIVSSLITVPGENNTAVLTAVDATVTADTDGALIVNIFGELIGVADSVGGNRFIPVNVVSAVLAEAKANN